MFPIARPHAAGILTPIGGAPMTNARSRTPTKKADSAGPSVDDWTRSVDAFTRMIDRLQSDYAELEARHTALNAELAQVNENLREAAEANRRLAANRDRVVAAVTSGIIAVDAGGVVRLFNPAAADLLGLAREDVLNRHYADVWPERKDDSATALACVQGASPVNNCRREVRRVDQMPLVLSVSTALLGFADPPKDRSATAGEEGGAIEIFSDLTPLERMHTEVARMRTLAALGEMSATIAHEIRNPLGGILGFAELLARRADGDAQQEDMLAKIVAGAQHLNTLVSRLLEFAREPQLDARPVKWRQYLDAVIDQYEEGARRRGSPLKLVRRWSEQLETGSADSLCLRQAIWNVLENAEQAVGAVGKVEVTAEARTGGGLHLRIADSGDGIDPRLVDRVFFPFVTTKKKGTGLGLATAKKLIEAHGGTISVDSKTGHGTTVRVELPPANQGD